MMEAILISYHVPIELVSAIMSLYKSSSARVCTTDGLSDPILLSRGVLQGDTLAPYLFIVVMDYILRNAINDELGYNISPYSSNRRSASRILQKFLSNLAFADDIALLCSSFNDAQTILSAIVNTALTIGLKMNLSKTEYLLVGTWPTPLPNITINNVAINRVYDYKYLGSYIMNSTKDFVVRKALAWSAIIKLNSIWKSCVFTRRYKLNIFYATVESVLLYGAETWTMTKTLSKSLDGCYTRLLRYALNIPWQSHTTNIILYSNDVQYISDKLRTRRLKFAGHCYRTSQHTPQPISDILFLDFPQHKYYRGQSNTLTYPELLTRDTNRTTNELKIDMLNRDEWRKQIVNLV